jgi:signal transduction histidine kinase
MTFGVFRAGRARDTVVGSMAPAPETLRLLRLAGVFTWLLVAAPQGIEGVGPPGALVPWLAALALFGALYAWTISRRGPVGPSLWAGLVVQTACVIVMAATQYRGLEGTLLVLIALELGLVAPRRVGLVWIAAQSLALMWAIQHHWSLRPALMFAPPYVGFQVLTFLMVELLDREARARAELARINAELVAARGRLEESARLRERLRIARELHDALGHHLSLINVQSGVALHLNEDLPDQARSSLSAIKEASKEALVELRSVLDILREEGEHAPRSPTSTLARLEDLVSQAAAAGLEVRTHTEGTVRPLPFGVDVAAFRIVQEALTNVTRHAGEATATIRLSYGERDITVEVDDDGGGPASRATVGTGRGIVGMRERVSALGGELETGPRPEGGFRVRARLPLDGAP